MEISEGLSLVQSVVKVLGSPVWMRIEAALGLESQLDKLKETMSTIEAVFLDAEVEDRLHQTRTFVERNRLQRLKEALYRADDLLDEIATHANRKKLMPYNNKVFNEVCLFFSRSNQLQSAFTWSREIKNILEMLDDIVKDHRHNSGLRHPLGLNAKLMRINARETHSFVCDEDVFIGREVDKQKVVDMLLDDTSVGQDVVVVSIVGIGGLGKTTLAQQAYNDERIGEKFPRKMWICVSDDFNVKALVGQILVAAKAEIRLDGMSMDQLLKELQKELDKKKYLLVLDDVWNEDPSKWHELRNLLVGGERVSRILVTTRSKKVADVVGSCWTHVLKGLSDKDSWTLFQKMALKPEDYPMKPQLVDIGIEIVQKCANVPLAIRVVGSLLRGEDESKWENVKSTDLANIIQDEINGIVPVLKISYNYLPFHLKRCFSYCAVFPKDYKIIKEDLICLWMAQGFIMLSDGQNFEDAGEEYFKQLLQRCFFQDVELAEGTDEIISFKMHDLIHDLAKEVVGTEILSCNYSTRCFNEKTRHVYFDNNAPEDLLGNLNKMRRMRTILCNDLPFSCKRHVVEVSTMKYLRVLWFTRTDMKTLPRVMGELLHLRYLDLSHNYQLYVLPSSITNLYNLQTLKLRSCKSLIRLPRELRKLVNLRHLDISDCRSLTHMPPGMNSMKSLKKLNMFVVGGSGRSNVAWNWWSTGVGQCEDLDDFTNYTRTMKIIVKKCEGYIAAETMGGGMLLKSHNLWEVMYAWEFKRDENYDAEALLQGLKPHSNVRKFKLCGYPGVRLPTWMMTLGCCLPDLIDIVISDCERLEHLPLMSQLRHLKVLEFDGLYGVEYINSGDEDELVFFPSLEKLKLENMAKLKGWWKPSSSESGESDRIPQAPLLSELYVSDCPNLTTLFLGSSMNLKSCLPNLAEIEIRNCERLEHLPMMSQLRHLKVLELSGLSEVEYMESSSINSGDEDELVFFPSLEKLKVGKMAKLKGWWKPSSSESGVSDWIPQAPLLSELYVSDCPNLTALFVGSSMNHNIYLPNLTEIMIRDCKRLEHLPLMSKQRYLKVLKLEDLGRLEYMESNSNNISGANDDELFMFPSLEKVQLWDMPKLKGWWKSSSESEKKETPQAPKLSHLEIRTCPELTTFPLCPGLQQLELRDFNEALGPIMRETTQQKEEGPHGSLREVWTDNLPYLKNSLPVRSFHHHSNLRIYRDQKMEELKTGEVGEVFRSGRLSSLRSLVIIRCDNLKSISGRGVWDQFTALESLSLSYLHKLELEDEDDVC